MAVDVRYQYDAIKGHRHSTLPKYSMHTISKKDKNTIKHGKNRAGQVYKCLHCNKFFTETKNTPIYKKHLTEQQIANICKHLVEKNGIRSIERLTGHHRDTIGNLLEDMAEHATKVNDYLMKNVGLSRFECDELWTFVKKRENT